MEPFTSAESRIVWKVVSSEYTGGFICCETVSSVVDGDFVSQLKSIGAQQTNAHVYDVRLIIFDPGLFGSAQANPVKRK